MMKELKIRTTATEKDIEIIERWLIKEGIDFGDSFHSDWSTIRNAFEEQRMFILEYSKDVIGFATWRKDEDHFEANIEYFEIHPDQRRKGYGDYFYTGIAQEFKEQGLRIVTLTCEPEESKSFWERMGFSQFPNRHLSDPVLTYFDPLIEIIEATDNPNDFNKIELWDVNPNQANNAKPRWSWNLEDNSEQLNNPIIQPCNPDWNLRWTKNGVVVKEDKVKYFSESDNPIYFSPFLIVERL